MCLLSLLVCFVRGFGKQFYSFCFSSTQCYFSFFSSLLTMEDLTKNLSELSLSDREHAGFVLPKIHKSGEYIIVAKFLTSCYLIVEAVVRTFQQRWRSMNGYKIRNLGDYRVLFVFDNNSDVERIIKNQPWSFDKHLVVLQTFEEFSKLKRSSF